MHKQYSAYSILVLLYLPTAANAQFGWILDILNGLAALFCAIPILNLVCPQSPLADSPLECEDKSVSPRVDIKAECTISGNSVYLGQSCAIPDLGVVEPCMERPVAATLHYTGGDCSQSNNDQATRFTCEDFEAGPPSREGEESFIKVTDLRDNSTIYFEGIVAVGHTFPLSDGDERFAADQIIEVLSANKKILLQKVWYHTSCSDSFKLKDRFGALELVEFTNLEQGLVSCFATFNFEYDISMPSTAVGESFEIMALTASTNFAGLMDLTDQVAGKVVNPGGSVLVTLEGTIDATERKRYTIVYEIDGHVVSDDTSFCSGTETLSFMAGHDLE